MYLTAVRRFLGLCNTYEQHIKNYMPTAKPLLKMTEKHPPSWGKEQDEAFHKLKVKHQTTCGTLLLMLAGYLIKLSRITQPQTENYLQLYYY